MIGTSETKAKTEADRLNKMLRDGTFQFTRSATSADDDCPTLKEYFDRFIKQQRGAYTDSTVTSYKGSFKHHIVPVLGKFKLSEITRAQVAEFISNLVDKNLSRSSIRIVAAELCAVFNHAIDHNLLAENPARKLTKIYKQAPRSRKRFNL